MEKISYGIQIEPQFGYTYQEISKIAKTAEYYGFESLWTSDHFLIRSEATDVNCLECWTILSALSTETKTLRLGNMVASQSYRNPSLHAKIAASLDHISNGRVYFGIGAGWKEVEYDAYGYSFPKPLVRVKQMEEAIKIAKQMWRYPVAKFCGEYYKVNSVAMPKPVNGHIPIVIGGMGISLLRVAAKHADISNFAWNIPLTVYKEKIDLLRKYCKKYSRDYYDIQLSAGLNIALKGAKAPRLAPYEKYVGKKTWDYLSPQEAVNILKGYSDLGVTHFVLVFPFGAEVESIKIIMDQINPFV
jgi:alkanesulfonate monooxygenase SsuD/methylene tetrahydromethanopterin reductase-like flavin-dependent oxidoreductase (luciferase family)